MLRFIYADDLHRHSKLAQGMFRDRADQFATRLGWDVSVDASGEERDEYDALNPLYVIWENADGGHGGSMRFLPTTGRCMVNEHFGHLISGPIVSPFIWECTRFCLSADAGRHVAAALMLGGGELMARFDVQHFVGVFDRRMTRIYTRTGAAPDILGWSGAGRDAIGVGLWHYDAEAKARLCARAGIMASQSALWCDLAFGIAPEDPATRFAAQ